MLFRLVIGVGLLVSCAALVWAHSQSPEPVNTLSDKEPRVARPAQVPASNRPVIARTEGRILTNTELQVALERLDGAIKTLDRERISSESGLDRAIRDEVKRLDDKIDFVIKLGEIILAVLIAILGSALVVWQRLIRVETLYEGISKKLEKLDALSTDVAKISTNVTLMYDKFDLKPPA